MNPLFRPRKPTQDHPLVRWSLTLLALGFIGLFLVLPLVTVFAEALTDGAKAALAAIREPEAKAAIRLTLIAAGISLLKITQPTASTTWISEPGAYSARCSTGAVNALIITPLRGAPVFHPSPDATWGLHLVDANIALGNLTADVSRQAKAWRKANITPKSSKKGKKKH